MAGLVPAIPIRETQRVRQFYVYILASRPGGALYVGVANNLTSRVYEHKNKIAEGHTKRLIAKENAACRDLYDEIARP
jgi:predicted GIY-YIG superfamily endonuclease